MFDLQFWQQFGVSASMKETVLHQAEKMEKLFATYAEAQPDWFDYFLLPFYEANQLTAVKKFALTRKELKLLQELATLEQHKELANVIVLKPLHEVLKPISDNAVLFYISANDVMNEQLIVSYVQKRQQMESFLTGGDLIQAGFKPGEAFSEILLQQEIAILEGTITSKEEALSWLTTQK